MKESFACDGQPGSYSDVDHADVIALYGHNVAETQTVLWMRMLDRLAGPNPPKLICVGPRQTPVARTATVHLAPLPGTNVALMNGILHEIIRNDWVDHDYVTAHTVGYDELTAQVERYSPARVAEICQLPAEQIREAARILGTAQRLLSTVLQGFYPAVSLPELRRIRSILSQQRLFLVVQYLFLTETAALADVVLPAATWGEKTGTFTNAGPAVDGTQRRLPVTVPWGRG